MRPHRKLLVWLRRAPKIDLLRPSPNLNSAFFKFQTPQPIASGHDVIHVPGPISYQGILLWHLWLSHPPRARVNSCTQCVHLTNPCTKQKVLSLTNPKGKIYKTKNVNIKKKSLRNYITHLPNCFVLYGKEIMSCPLEKCSDAQEDQKKRITEDIMINKNQKECLKKIE